MSAAVFADGDHAFGIGRTHDIARRIVRLFGKLEGGLQILRLAISGVKLSYTSIFEAQLTSRVG
jgi:hypothetical protein